MKIKKSNINSIFLKKYYIRENLYKTIFENDSFYYITNSYCLLKLRKNEKLKELLKDYTFKKDKEFIIKLENLIPKDNIELVEKLTIKEEKQSDYDKFKSVLYNEIDNDYSYNEDYLRIRECIENATIYKNYINGLVYKNNKNEVAFILPMRNY